MAEVSSLYIKEMYKRFAYMATWLPNTKLKLGDVGFQNGGSFKRMTSLKELGLSFKIRSGKNPVDFTYTSQSGISIKTKLAGEIIEGANLPLNKAGLILDFNREGAFLFHASQCLVDELEDREGLGKTLIKLYADNNWNFNWSVVDTIVKANCVTIVVSNSKQANIELTAKSPLTAINLANVEAGLKVNSQRGDIIRFLATKKLSPLFKLSRLKKSLLKSLFGGAKEIHFGGKLPASDKTLPSIEQDVFEVVTPD